MRFLIGIIWNSRLCGINQQRINLWWSPFIDLRVTIKSIKRLIGKKWVDRPTNRPQSKCAASGKKHTNFSHDLGVVSFRNHHFLPNWWWKKGRFYVYKFLDFAGSIDPFRNTKMNGQSQKWLMECKMLSDYQLKFNIKIFIIIIQCCHFFLYFCTLKNIYKIENLRNCLCFKVVINFFSLFK